MKSISGKNWEELNLNKRLVDKAKIDHDFDDFQAKVIISRYFTETEIFSIKSKIQIQNPFFRDHILSINLILFK